jgi:hypothetical protein
VQPTRSGFDTRSGPGGAFGNPAISFGNLFFRPSPSRALHAHPSEYLAPFGTEEYERSMSAVEPHLRQGRCILTLRPNKHLSGSVDSGRCMLLQVRSKL